jgi:hypothetical protein
MGRATLAGGRYSHFGEPLKNIKLGRLAERRGGTHGEKGHIRDYAGHD